MAAEIWVNDGGVARRLRELWINDNGVARRLNELWTNDNGTPRCIFRGEIVGLTDNLASAFATTPNLPTATIRIRSDGIIAGIANEFFFSDPWIIPQINMAAYECFASVLLGTFTTGDFGVWLPLSTTREWSVSQTLSGTKTAEMTLQIRRIGQSQILTSAKYTLVAERQTAPTGPGGQPTGPQQ